jgi:hypothetical protein
MTSNLLSAARVAQGDNAEKPFRGCDVAAAGPIDPRPRALWRVLHWGEAANFIAPIDQETVLEAFAGAASEVERELAALGCGRAELFVLVTLLAEGTRAVTLATLRDETFLEADALVAALAQLDRCGAVLRSGNGVAITPAGRRLAVRAMFRALDAAAYGSWGACGAILR